MEIRACRSVFTVGQGHDVSGEKTSNTVSEQQGLGMETLDPGLRYRGRLYQYKFEPEMVPRVLDLSISPRTFGENSLNRCSRRRKRSSLCSGLHELPAKVNRGKKS
ncbi:hypothetical protein SRHO_G00246510 [Serrasalmus rhombeus]